MRVDTRPGTRQRWFRPLPVVVFATWVLAWVSLASHAKEPDRAQPLSNRRTEPPIISSIDARNVHSVNHIWLNVTNFGILGSEPGAYLPWSDSPSAQWPAPSETEYLYAAGLWVGARINDEPHVTTALYDMEFRPDPNALGRMYVAREGDPAGARAPSLRVDDDKDGKKDEDPLNGHDDDGDGLIDEDFAAISDQMFTCEYSDVNPSIQLRYPDHRSLGLRVQQTTMAWSGEGRRDFIGLNYKITSEQSIQEVYVGLFADPDIGPPDREARSQDDMAGFWEGDVLVRQTEERRVHVSIGYMWDADGDGIHSPGYVGFTFLGYERTGFGSNAQFRRVQPLEPRNFRFYSGNTFFDRGGEPTRDEERYKVLDGTAPKSLPRSRPWDPIESRFPNDYQFVLSTGPFGSLGPGDTLGISAALVIGDGFEGLKKAAALAKVAFDGAWTDCDGDRATGVNGRETPHCGPEEAGLRYPVDGPDRLARPGKENEPCDSTCAKKPYWWWTQPCSEAVPPDGCLWIDGDCDPTTGVDGKECWVHWFADIPPASPNMRLFARENRVEVMFDNWSERDVDPVLGVPDFESYRIWRADDWRRPPGSDLDTGPPPDAWRLLAEFDLKGNRIGPETGLEVIHYRPNVPDWVVQFCYEWDQAHPSTPPPALSGFTQAQLDTALALARGVRYYRYVDPPFIVPPRDGDPPCPASGRCDPVLVDGQTVFQRCDERGRCRSTRQPPFPGGHYFYGVTATDHRMEDRGGQFVVVGPGLAGSPQGNFQFINPPTDALPPAQYDQADDEIYVVPNPATPASMAPWRLFPNNNDPTGVKIEFHHLPAALGTVTIFTLSGDLVKELPFDGREGNGSLAWDLVSRNGQDVTSGVYLFVVQTNDPRFKRFVGKFVVIR